MTSTPNKTRALLLALSAGLILAFAAGCSEKPQTAGNLPKTVDGASVTWGQPSGVPAAVVILIHGGGWQPDPQGYAEQKASGKQLNGQGYATAAIGYDAAPKAFEQIQALYKQVRKHFPDTPVCASGVSAGGHLALMLAAKEPDLTCVLALAAPTDLTTIGQQDPDGEEAYNDAVSVFGADDLAKWSPVNYADKIKAKVQLVIAADDPVVPVAQGPELKKALPGAEFIEIPPGPVKVAWAHYGGVAEDAQNLVIAKELDFLRTATQAQQ